MAGMAAEKTATEDPSPYESQQIPTTAKEGTRGSSPVKAPDDVPDEAPSPPVDPDPPKQPFLKRVMAKIGLDVPTLILMFKGSLPPIISTAMYQSATIAGIFPSLGFLIPIICMFCIAILPRGKFIQMLVLHVLAICTAAALSLLILWTAVEARKHTSAPLTQAEIQQLRATGRPPYNSSQSAVSGIWLFVAIWFINLIRARVPSLNLPSIIFAIFINITCTDAPMIMTMTAAKRFVRSVLISMLFAMGISTGVSLFIFPMSSRQILMKQSAGCIGLLRSVVKLQGAYLRGLEVEDAYGLTTVETAVGDLGPDSEQEHRKDKKAPALTREEKAAQALRKAIGSLRDLTGKMQAELRFAKRDAAYGKLTAHDLGQVVKLLRNIVVPVTGMSTIMDIFRRTAERRGWNKPSDDDDDEEELDDDDPNTKQHERRLWSDIMRQLHEPFALLTETVDQGMLHAGLQLDLLPKTKEQKARDKARRAARRTGSAADREKNSDSNNSKEKENQNGAASADDVEARAGTCQPGDDGFAAVLQDKVRRFRNMHSEILRAWARDRGLLDDQPPATAAGMDPVFVAHEHRQAQLYILLFMEQLMHATSNAVQDLVDFADGKVADGTMDRTRLLLPTLRRLLKWVRTVFSASASANGSDSTQVFERSINVVFLGDGFGSKKDPEHLPATNAWQHCGNGIRAVSAFLGSEESAFGFRAACATMTIGIVCYLRDSQAFFIEQRLVWAMIMVAIGMSQTSGQSLFGFFLRVGGSIVSVVFSYIAWYIVDGKTAGVLVFMWLFIFIQYYFFIKYRLFVPATMICIVTEVLIIAYELQVRKVGIAVAAASGQKFYPIYELAPYRLATVIGGCFVAFLWTIFPQPITDRAWMRRDLSANLYLLANYFSVINETLRATMNQTIGEIDVAGTPAHRLSKVRQALFTKLMVLLPSLQAHAGWQKWEPTIGGRFPRAAYEDIILRSTRILNYLTLISYTVSLRPHRTGDGTGAHNDQAWLEALSHLIQNIGPTHYTILSTLTLLSNSLLSGQSLPPYIPLPRPYELTRQLLALKRRPHAGSAATAAAPAWRSGNGSDSNIPEQPTPPPPKRRNSIWSRRGSKHGTAPPSSSPAAEATGADQATGLYERRDVDDVLAPLQKRPTASAWRDATGNMVNTATGSPVIMRVPTRTASGLGHVLNAYNMDRHGYTEFAVLQVCSTLVCDDLEGMIQAVSGLVGVVDFSFRVDASDMSLDKGKGKTD